MDSVLVSEPVAALDSVVGVPAPIVCVHVSEGCVDASLGSHGMGASREQFRNTGSLESLFYQAEGCAKAGSSCAEDYCIEGMVDDGVLLEEGVLCVVGDTYASLPKEVLPTTAKPHR